MLHQKLSFIPRRKQSKRAICRRTKYVLTASQHVLAAVLGSSYHNRPAMSKTFDSFFKGLFIFRLHYLCAIGLGAIFSLRRSTPADLCSILKLHDSWKQQAYRNKARRTLRGFHPLWRIFLDLLSPAAKSLQVVPCTTIPRLPVPSAADSSIGFALFTRRYLGHHSCFLFLRLMICLSSARRLTQQRWILGRRVRAINKPAARPGGIPGALDWFSSSGTFLTA